PGGEPGIVPLHRNRLDPDGREAGRDLGLALIQVTVQGVLRQEGSSAEAAGQALGLLEAATQNDPGDLPAWEGKAKALALLNRQAEALATYEAILARAPLREGCLMGAATLAQGRQQVGPALSYWRRAVAVNPWQPTYRAS